VRRAIWITLVLAAIAAPLGWFTSDALESHNEFCTSCHLSADTPLHKQKLADFASDPPVNLASAHFAHDHAFRCVDCHGGASFSNHVRVKLLSVADGLLYLTGRFDEPRRMSHPLWNEDCTHCHDRYKAERDDAFHAQSVHNVAVFPFDCVECHQAHPTGRTREFAFLERARLIENCRTCHEEFQP
jgi:hypothetical protein